MTKERIMRHYCSINYTPKVEKQRGRRCMSNFLQDSVHWKCESWTKWKIKMCNAWKNFNLNFSNIFKKSYHKNNYKIFNFIYCFISIFTLFTFYSEWLLFYLNFSPEKHYTQVSILDYNRDINYLSLFILKNTASNEYNFQPLGKNMYFQLLDKVEVLLFPIWQYIKFRKRNL